MYDKRLCALEKSSCRCPIELKFCMKVAAEALKSSHYLYKGSENNFRTKRPMARCNFQFFHKQENNKINM